jgi:hypothetical protein
MHLSKRPTGAIKADRTAGTVGIHAVEQVLSGTPLIKQSTTLLDTDAATAALTKALDLGDENQACLCILIQVGR